MVQGQVFLKEGGWGGGGDGGEVLLTLFLFNCFKAYHLNSVMHLKIFFFCHHNFMNKGHSKLSKSKPENIP